MNIVIPLAGKDPRFPRLPKALQEIKNKLLICRILDQHCLESTDKVIAIILAEHEYNFGIGEKLRGAFNHPVTIRTIPTLTRGAPCTILHAVCDLINNDQELLIELGDVVRDLTSFYRDIRIDRHRENLSGIIPIEYRTFNRPWGYVTLKHDQTVKWLYEKRIIPPSNLATMGLYYFRYGRDFIWAVNEMILKESFLYKDNFFIGPVYNELIARGDRVVISHNPIQRILSTPKDIEQYGNICP